MQVLDPVLSIHPDARGMLEAVQNRHVSTSLMGGDGRMPRCIHEAQRVHLIKPVAGRWLTGPHDALRQLRVDAALHPRGVASYQPSM